MLKTLSFDRVFSMDRGGVEPLERDDESTPKNRLDSALKSTQILYQNKTKRRAPKLGALRSHKGPDHSGFVILTLKYSKPSIICQEWLWISFFYSPRIAANL
jgi:asparagine synthetase B (glutamine-hydrolysing)